MAMTAADYRRLAAASLSEAEVAVLDQVRARCLRSAAALTRMAEDRERVVDARAARLPPPATPPGTAGAS